MVEQLEKLRVRVEGVPGMVDCDAFGHLVRLGVVSWEMLGEMSDEEWQAVKAGVPQSQFWEITFDDFHDKSLFQPGHMSSLRILRMEARVAAAARERERKREERTGGIFLDLAGKIHGWKRNSL